MSTRAQIGFYETAQRPILRPDALIYKHSDGYPEGITPLLTGVVSEFFEVRGKELDAEYLAAWVLFEFMRDSAAWLDKQDAGTRKMFSFTGFGICGRHGVHGDTQYFYRVDPETISIFLVKDYKKPETWECVEVVRHEHKDEARA